MDNYKNHILKSHLRNRYFTYITVKLRKKPSLRLYLLSQIKRFCKDTKTNVKKGKNCSDINYLFYNLKENLFSQIFLSFILLEHKDISLYTNKLFFIIALLESFSSNISFVIEEFLSYMIFHNSSPSENTEKIIHFFEDKLKFLKFVKVCENFFHFPSSFLYNLLKNSFPTKAFGNLFLNFNLKYCEELKFTNKQIKTLKGNDEKVRKDFEKKCLNLLNKSHENNKIYLRTIKFKILGNRSKHITKKEESFYKHIDDSIHWNETLFRSFQNLVNKTLPEMDLGNESFFHNDFLKVKELFLQFKESFLDEKEFVCSIYSVLKNNEPFGEMFADLWDEIIGNKVIKETKFRIDNKMNEFFRKNNLKFYHNEIYFNNNNKEQNIKLLIRKINEKGENKFGDKMVSNLYNFLNQLKSSVLLFIIKLKIKSILIENNKKQTLMDARSEKESKMDITIDQNFPNLVEVLTEKQILFLKDIYKINENEEIKNFFSSAKNDMKKKMLFSEIVLRRLIKLENAIKNKYKI